MAEVLLRLDNTDRSAPAAFNDADTIEVSRRIEREAGSIYRVNGREVRARDVQLLFADASTGARSPSMVRQGQIGELISAKPQDRRRILEEAAGVAGLHSRRHEAELRLKAAEENLARLDDVLQPDRLAGERPQAPGAAGLALPHHRRRDPARTRPCSRSSIMPRRRRRSPPPSASSTPTSARSSSGRGSRPRPRALQAVAAHELRGSPRSRGARPRAELQKLVLARETLDGEERRVKGADRRARAADRAARRRSRPRDGA